MRENVENLTAIRDWCEAVVAANIVFEPLVGELFRGGYVMATAAANGDFITPTVMGVAESDFDRDLGYTKDLVGGLTRDEQFGAANIETIGGWLSAWIPQSLAAAHSLAPIFTEAEHSPVTFEDTLARARERVREVLGELDIPTPKELDR